MILIRIVNTLIIITEMTFEANRPSKYLQAKKIHIPIPINDAIRFDPTSK